jgi:hypothetical protein
MPNTIVALKRLAVLALLALAVLGQGAAAPARKPTAEDLERLLERIPPEPNPFVSLLPLEARPDWQAWRARLRSEGERRRLSRGPDPPAIVVTGDEPAGEVGLDDLPRFAQEIPGLGTRVGETPRAIVSGHLLPVPATLGAVAEPDGALPLAHPATIGAGAAVALDGVIGDGEHGSAGIRPTGDFDFYRLEAVAGQRIEVLVSTPIPLGDLDPVAALYDAAGRLLAVNDEIVLQGFLSTLDSYLAVTAEADGTYFVAVAGFFPGADDETKMLPADPFDPASGPGAGSEGTYELILGLDLPELPDADFYRFDLRSGDVVGATVLGHARRLRLFALDGAERVSGVADLSALYPAASPLPGGGRASIAYVADAPGTYAVGVDRAAGLALAGDGSYTIELTLARAGLDRRAVPGVQVLFLDFDGAAFDAVVLHPALGPVTLTGLPAFLPRWGLSPADGDAVIDAVVAAVEESLSRDVRDLGANGDFDAGGVAGRFDVEIRNSRDHADPWGDPGVSRVIVGGTVGELGLALIGLAESIDVGNFAGEETAVVLLDLMSAPAPNPNSLNSVELAAGADKIALVGLGVGNVAAHEAGHFFGNYHTRRGDPQGTAGFANVMDRIDLLGELVGEDGVFGSADDADVDFGPDAYSPEEVFTGLEQTLEVLSFDLPAGGLRAEVAVDPSTLELGAVALGASATGAIRVSNEGFLDLELVATALGGPDAGDFAIDAGGAPATLVPGTARTLDVRFQPGSPGRKQATLSIASDDPDDGTVEVELGGYGGVPDVAVVPPAHDFGDLVYGPPGLSASHTFVVANTDPAAELHVLDLTFTGATPESFAVAAGDAPPWVLPGGGARPLVVTFAPGGRIGAMSARLRLSSNDPDDSPFDVLLNGRALGPDVAVMPSPYHFGAWPVGSRAFRHFVVSNEGPIDLEVSSAALDGEAAGELEITSGGGAFTLAPGEARNVTVFFTPLTGGVKRATLEFASNDPDEGSLRVSIVGVGLEPMIAVEPAAHDFGEVTALAQRDHDFQLTNVGQATLAGTAEIAGPQAGDFSLVAGGGAFSLRPGVSRAMTVRFRPTSTGARQGALRLTSNDLARPELEAPLAGLGVAAVDVPALSPWAGAVLAAALALAALVWLRRAQAVS